MSSQGPASVHQSTDASCDDKKKCEEKIDDYDAVLFTVCDMFGRPRGKFAVGEGIQEFAKHGMETAHTTCVQGFHSELPTSVPTYTRTDDITCFMRPDLTTLKPLSWLCQDNRKVGHVLCNLYTSQGQREPSSPRDLAIQQVEALKELGYQVMSSFETEYTVYHKGTLDALGGNFNDMINMWRLDSEMSFLYDHIMGLIASGIPVETQMEEFAPGQIEYSLIPQFGVQMADSVHRLRYITKSLCELGGFEPTFMTRVKSGSNSSGFHFNHSLWTLDGKNAFYDPEGEEKCSDVLRHWVAGLVHHGNAICVFLNPTVNCYERLHGFFAPSDNVWNYNDKNASIRVKNKGSNIHMEYRVPSSACNPYLSLAAVIAAGIDGLKRKLEPPPPRPFRPLLPGDERAKPVNPLPKTLDEALQALEEDEILKQALGEDFVRDYVLLTKEFQLNKLKGVMDKEQDERVAAERELYLHTL